MTELDVSWGRPDPRLRRLLRPYCGYVERTAGRLVRPELPHPNVTLILSFGPAIDFPELGFRRGSFAAGIDTSPVVTAHDGYQAGIELNLSPPLASMLLGRPAGDLAADAVELDDLLGREGRELPERLHAARDWAARFALVDDWVVRRMAAAEPPPGPVIGTWAALVASGGRTPIADIARDLGWSRRHLTERFTRDVGVAPKTYARILRFDRALSLIARADGRALGDVALDAGYYDQAHLNRDFREFSGAAPSRLPFVQDRLEPAA